MSRPSLARAAKSSGAAMSGSRDLRRQWIEASESSSAVPPARFSGPGSEVDGSFPQLEFAARSASASSCWEELSVFES